MNHSGDAAEQMVRMSLDGVEVAAKITGAAAKEIAIFLIAALKNKDNNLKTHGKARMKSMLKSGKALEIFSVKESDLEDFMQGAKQYGVVYCVLRNTKNSPDGLCDIMVKADDAPKISRLVERLNIATVDKATIQNEIVPTNDEKTTAPTSAPSNLDNTEALLDEFLGTDKEKAQADSRPLQYGGRTPPPIRPSEPTSANRNNSARGITDKPSVKEEIGEIITARNKKSERSYRVGRVETDRPKNSPTFTTHRQPKINSKIKHKNSRERF